MKVTLSSVLGNLWFSPLNCCHFFHPLLKILHYSLWSLPPTWFIFSLKYRDQKRKSANSEAPSQNLTRLPWWRLNKKIQNTARSICDDFIPPLIVKLPLGVWLSQRSIIRKSQETGSHRDNLIFRKDLFVNLAEKWMCGWASVFVHSENVCCLCKCAILCLHL